MFFPCLSNRFQNALLLIALLILNTACSPHLNWREVRGTTIPFTVLLPAKPSMLSRDVNIAGSKVEMSMTAVEIDGVTYAVGTAQMTDAAAARIALPAMKTALINNIGGKLMKDSSATASSTPANAAQNNTAVDIEARGAPPPNGKQPRLMMARLIAKDRYVYQALITGPEDKVLREAVDTFFTSFKTQ